MSKWARWLNPLCIITSIVPLCPRYPCTPNCHQLKILKHPRSNSILSYFVPEHSSQVYTAFIRPELDRLRKITRRTYPRMLTKQALRSLLDSEGTEDKHSPHFSHENSSVLFQHQLQLIQYCLLIRRDDRSFKWIQYHVLHEGLVVRTMQNDFVKGLEWYSTTQ